MAKKNQGVIVTNGSIQADQLVVGPGASAEKTVHVRSVDQSRHETTNISNSSNINVKSTLTNVQQTVGGMAAGSAAQKEALRALLATLGDALQKVPPHKAEEAEATAAQAAGLVEAAAKGAPNRTMLKIIAGGLKETANFLKEVAPDAVTVAGQIVALVGKIHGMGL